MTEEVKERRPYDGSRRRAAAQETRRAIVEAARRLFLERGFTATTMGAIATAAGVSHETVYAFGPKPALFRHLVEIALSGSESPVPGMERDYARQVMAETDPGRLFDIYAGAMRQTQERLAPLFDVLSDGARTDPDLKALSDELSARRAGHMRLLATHLAEIGGLRQGVSVERAADVIWLLNSSEVFLLLVRDRRWDPELFERWLAETWKLLLMAPPAES
ncbi:MAG TPA: helix-turn-helix domain-containing protein [Candidatus Dormibacteraeota bacterium]